MLKKIISVYINLYAASLNEEDRQERITKIPYGAVFNGGTLLGTVFGLAEMYFFKDTIAFNKSITWFILPAIVFCTPIILNFLLYNFAIKRYEIYYDKKKALYGRILLAALIIPPFLTLLILL